MHVQLTTDNHVDGGEGLQRHVESVVGDTLERFGARVTRVDVHVGDANGRKAGSEWCSMEAKLAGLQPIAVKVEAATLNKAIDEAAEKLLRAIDRTVGRKEDPKGGPTVRKNGNG